MILSAAPFLTPTTIGMAATPEVSKTVLATTTTTANVTASLDVRLPISSPNGNIHSPHRLRSAVQGFFRAAAAPSPTVYIADGSERGGRGPEQSLASSSSGSQQQRKLTRAELQWVLDDPQQFLKIQQTLRNHQCQTHSLVRAMGPDLMWERYTDLRDLTRQKLAAAAAQEEQELRSRDNTNAELETETTTTALASSLDTSIKEDTATSNCSPTSTREFIKLNE